MFECLSCGVLLLSLFKTKGDNFVYLHINVISGWSVCLAVSLPYMVIDNQGHFAPESPNLVHVGR